MLRNEEFKSVLKKLVIFQLIIALITSALVFAYVNKVNKNIINQNIALVGKIVKDNPELKDKIIPYITKGARTEDVIIGEEILNSYGYNVNLNKSSQPILKGIYPNFIIINFILIILFLLPLLLIIKLEYEKIYGKVQEVYKAAEKVVEGDFSTYLKEEGEGDFNILNHQFNQMSNRLEHTLDSLNNEKIFLKDTISDISHQLKTPLSSLIVFNDILLEGKDMDLGTKVDFLERSSVQLERIEWLIINLLKLARIEAGAIEFKKEKVLLSEVVETALNTLSYNLDDQEVVISGNKDSGFLGDREWTTEALINIIKNSTEHGKGKIEIVLEETPLFSNVIIRDQGEGIDKENLPHIFERFYKVNSEVKPQSIGIGLNLSKLIVESQGGTISVKSKKGYGTEIMVTFLNTHMHKEKE